MPVLQSFIAGQWFGKTESKALISAINGTTVAHTHQEEINFREAVAYARNTGVRNMLALDFHS